MSRNSYEYNFNPDELEEYEDPEEAAEDYYLPPSKKNKQKNKAPRAKNGRGFDEE